MAARAGHTEVAKYLLQNKAKVNAKAKVSSGGRKGRVPGSLQPGEGNAFWSEARGSQGHYHSRVGHTESSRSALLEF